MQSVLVLDPTICTGCRTCEIACSLYHEDECNPEKSRIRVVKDEMQGIFTPMTCIHCEEGFCVDICPVRALEKDRKTGEVVLNEETCIGCKLCIYVCPLSAPSYDPDRSLVVKCDLCEGDPVCVKFCEPNAIQFIPVDQLSMVLKRMGASKMMDFQVRMLGSRPATTE